MEAPLRDAPPPPGGPSGSSGIESAVAELKAALARDPEGFTKDAKAKEILDRLNDEIARVYGEGDDEGSEYDDEDEEDDEEGSYYSDEEGDEYDDEGDAGADDGGRGSESGSKDRGEAKTELPKGPRPYDLWRAAHEIERPAKERLVLTGQEWGALVHRLNESSRRKQGYLLRAQHQQIAAELAGLTFAPHISERSRELAAQNKSLPARVEALMRRKKAKLDRIRHDRVEAELREATFRPNLAATKNARAAKTVAEKRRIGHLMQYEMDKRLRASQRRALISEMESRDLTFNPAINRNSARIVERLNRERQAQASAAAAAVAAGADPLAAAEAAAAAEGGAGGPSSRVTAAKKALNAALAAGLSLPTAAQVTGLPMPDPRMLKGLGRSYLPGHEQETFHPRINPRSAALHQAAAARKAGADGSGGGGGGGGEDVYARLYEAVTAARSTKLRDGGAAGAGGAAAGGPRSSPSKRMGGSGGLGATGGSTGAGDGSPSLRDAGGFPVDEHGEPLPGHPHFFNVIPFDGGGSGRMDFILRRLVPADALAAAASAAAASGAGAAGTA